MTNTGLDLCHKIELRATLISNYPVCSKFIFLTLLKD